MGDLEVLTLHGSPGAGKSTLAESVVERLRQSDVPTALIDLDALSIVYPHPGPLFSRANLRAVWPNYAAVAGVKVILPLVVRDSADLEELREITSPARLRVCELTASRGTLEARVTAREPNDFCQTRLMHWVDVFHRRDELGAIRDFEVSTEGRSVEESLRR